MSLSFSTFALLCLVACSDPVHTCFGSGTLIQTPKGAVKIEELRVGDLVFGFDHIIQDRVPMRIVRTFVHPNETTYALRDATGKVVHITPNHPVYDAGEGRYVAAENLSLYKSRLSTFTNEERKIVSLSRERGVRDVYNIEVEELHNYFAASFLVHNKGAQIEDRDLDGVLSTT